VKEASEIQQQEQNNKLVQLPFVHIYLHDLESLWWVAVWIVFYNEFCARSGSDADAHPNLKDIERQLEAARFLFPSVLNHTGRQNTFQVELSFSEIYQRLPPLKHTACYYLDVLRRNLIGQYKKVEVTLPHSIDVPAIKDDIYDAFHSAFDMFQESEFTLSFIPDIGRELVRMGKRARPDWTAETKGPPQKKIL